MTLPDVSPLLVATIAAVFVFAGFVKGVIGVGLPAIAIGVLSIVMAPAQAAALLIVPSTITNLQQMRPAATLPRLLRRLWPMLAGAVAGIAAGGGFIAGANAAAASGALGLALATYGLIGLFRIRFRIAPSREPWLGPLTGIVTGLVTAATGVFVLPSVIYMQAIGLEKDDLVQAMGLTFFVATVALAATLVAGQVAGNALLLASAAALLPTLVGQALGQALRNRISAATFLRLFQIGLTALGAYLALRYLLR